MKIIEIISEANRKPLRKGVTQPLSDLTTYPDMNMNTGSAYMNYRFGLAVAGSPDVITPAEGAFGGDPLTVTYTQEEADILNAAAKMVGCGSGTKHSKRGSAELESTHKQSPVPARRKNKYGV